MFAIDQPAFEAMARSDAITSLKSLPPGVLDHVAEQIREFNSRSVDDIDEATAHRLVTELTFVHFLLPVSISNPAANWPSSTAYSWPMAAGAGWSSAASC